MRALAIGGTGFIGLNLVDELLAQGAQVRVTRRKRSATILLQGRSAAISAVIWTIRRSVRRTNTSSRASNSALRQKRESGPSPYVGAALGSRSTRASLMARD